MSQFQINTSRRDVLRAAAAGAAALSLGVQAQSGWPSKPVNMVVPFPAGGGTDAFARPLSAQFAKLTGKQLIIDNRGGAGGTLGAGIAAKAAPDGYTLFMGAVHHSIAPSMYPKLDYDLQKDVVPLALVANVPQVLVVNPKNMPFDYKGFLEAVRKAPGKFKVELSPSFSLGDERIIPEIIPFVIVVFGCLMVITYFPPLSLSPRDLVYH